MPERKTIERARQAEKEGKSASTQAGEFVREEIDHIRQGRHGARSTKQAIAIGLSKARRAGVKLAPPEKGSVSEGTRRKAIRDYEMARTGKQSNPSPKRARATSRALKRETRTAASKEALSKQPHRLPIGGAVQQDRRLGEKLPGQVLEIVSRELIFTMSDVEDYLGPTKGHGEKCHDGRTAKADESMVTPPACPEEAGSRKNELEQQNTRRRMKRIISMKVVRVNTDSESKPCVILQCPKGEEIAPRATVTTRPIFPEQEALVESADRVKVLGKGKPNIGLGDVVDVQII